MTHCRSSRFAGAAICLLLSAAALPAPAAPPSPVAIAVDAAQGLRTVDARCFAINAAVWDADFDSPGTASLLKEMGVLALRFPGGSLSDEYHWATNRSLTNTWTWATSFDRFAHIAGQIGAHVCITVNYGTGTPAEAAAWVRHANVTNHFGVASWEIGNELYGSWEHDANDRPHDPYTYAVRTKDYIAQMKDVDPSIRVGVVVTPGEDRFATYADHPAANPRTGRSHDGWTPVLLATLKGLGVTPDFVVHHRYAQEPGGESDAALLQSSASWADDAADLRRQIADYFGPGGEGIELVSTENNSVSHDPGKQTTSLVNGLFQADSLCRLLRTEFNGLFWWDLRNGQDPGNNNAPSLYGWRQYGDYGIVNGQTDRYPVFYAAKLLQWFARPGDTVVSASSGDPLLAAYAVHRLGGELALLVINKSPAESLAGSVAIAGFTPGSTATVRTYGIPQDVAAQTRTGSRDIATTEASGMAADFTYAFPPYSLTLFTLSPRAAGPAAFRRGDANADGAIDLGDAVVIVSRLFLGSEEASCREASDANDDGAVDVSDAVLLLSYLFLEGEGPPGPLASCGIDPTPDGLGCESFPGCP